MDADLLIVGGGPAGLALGSAAVRRGLSVLVVDPAPTRPWGNNYGVWADELAALGLDEVAARRWGETSVSLDDGEVVRLGRGYCQVDGVALKGRLGAPTVQGRVADLSTHEAVLEDGRRLQARVVVDCSGHQSAHVRRRRGRGPGFQAAWGLQVRVDAHPWALDEMRLMDFSSPPGADPATPSFLYVMPYSPDRLFVEETSLVGRPGVAFEVLEGRLRARLSARGVSVRAVESVERCWIPMGVPLPLSTQPILAFGGAASMVHPATGYLLASVLRQADSLAAALAETPTAAAGWGALWPSERRRVWTILAYGMEVLLTLDQPEVRAFFRAFFAAPGWQAFLAGTQTVSALTRTMRHVFSRVPPALKVRLMGGALSGPGGRMFGALAGWA